MILAISGSPRKNRMIHSTLQEILKDCNEPYEIISLAGKKISGCIACTMCAKDNICKVKDDWNEIGDKMKQADIIIFGAPNYYENINALAHACLERTFAFRHLGGFSLQNKLGISVSSHRRGSKTDPVKVVIERMMVSNKMEVIGHVEVLEYSQCYTCGYGQNCEYGSVVREHGVLEKIEPCHLPEEVIDQPQTKQQITKIREVLEKRGVTFG